MHLYFDFENQFNTIGVIVWRIFLNFSGLQIFGFIYLINKKLKKTARPVVLPE